MDLSIVEVTHEMLAEWLRNPPWPVSRAILDVCHILMPEATIATFDHGVVVTGTAVQFIFANRDGCYVGASRRENSTGGPAITGFVFSESPSARLFFGLDPVAPHDLPGTRKELMDWMVTTMLYIRDTAA
jgi:hypothetical protein